MRKMQSSNSVKHWYQEGRGGVSILDWFVNSTERKLHANYLNQVYTTCEAPTRAQPPGTTQTIMQKHVLSVCCLGCTASQVVQL